MGRARTTVEISPVGYEALVALLKYQCGKIDGDALKAILMAQGRPENTPEGMAIWAAESVLMEVS